MSFKTRSFSDTCAESSFLKYKGLSKIKTETKKGVAADVL